MVKVYFKSSAVDVPLQEVMSSSPNDLILKAVNSNDPNFGLTYCGKLINNEMPVLHEKDSLRVVEVAKRVSEVSSDSVVEKRKDVTKGIRYLASESGIRAQIKMHEEMDKTDYPRKVLSSNGEIRGEPHALDILLDYQLLVSYFLTKVGDNVELDAWLSKNPKMVECLGKIIQEKTKQTQSRATAIGSAGISAAAAPPPAPRAPISYDVFQRAMESALQFNPANAAAAQQPPNQQPIPQQIQGLLQAMQPQMFQQRRNNEEQIASAAANFALQMAQLHEFGFTDEGQCLVALQHANGDVQMALEYLIAMNQ